MTKPEILVSGSYPDWDMDGFRKDFTCHMLEEGAPLSTLSDALRARIAGMAFKSHAMDPEMMDALPALKIIANYGVGYDAIDVAAADARGIAVTNTPDVLSDEVADLAVGMLIAQARRIVEAEAWVTEGLWAKQGAFPLQARVWGRKAEQLWRT
ncbi:MAG: 2-hydroxyacid dehydrogenase, partial [Pseudomonadota bacterium]